MPIEYQMDLHQQDNPDDNDKLKLMDMWGRFRAQRTSMMAAYFLLMPGGMYLSMGTYETLCPYPECHYGNNVHMICSWFVGCIIGLIVGVYLIQIHLKRFLFNFIGGSLILISAILLINAPNDNTFLLSSRYLEGIGHGIIAIYAIIHSAEISYKICRGHVVSGVNTCITSVIYIHVYLNSVYREKEIEAASHLAVVKFNIPSKQLYAFYSIAFTIIALIIACFLRYDSPVELIRKGKEADANILLQKLQREPPNSTKIKYQIDEFKNMIDEEINQSKSIFSGRNWIPLLRIGVFRIVVVLSTSLFINSLLINIAIKHFGPKGFTLVILVRLLGEIINVILLDRIGRRKPLIFSTAIAGVLLVALGILRFLDLEVSVSTYILSMLFQFFFGLGVSNISVMCMAESFPLSKKTYSIGFVYIIENILQMILTVICINTTLISDNIEIEGAGIYIFLLAVLYLICTFFFYKFVPETKKLSLKQCQNIFKEW